MATFENVYAVQGSLVTPTYLLNLEDGFEEIIQSQDTLKEKLIAILKDKDIVASSSESLSELVAHFKDLQNTNLKNSEYTEDLINITETVQSGQIQLLMLDGGPVNFKIYVCKDNIEATTQGSFQVDWGDGTVETYNNVSDVSHTFISGSGQKYDDSHNQHVVTIMATDGKINGFLFNECANLLAFTAKDLYMSYFSNYTFCDCKILKYIDVFGGSLATSERNTTFYGFCANCTSLVRIKAPVCWSSITSLQSAFSDCQMLETIDLGEVWNTENCKNFYNTYYNCSSLKIAPGINTSQTTTVSGLYQNCSSLENINCEYLNLEKCTSCANLFYACNSIKNIPRLLNTDRVITFNNAFYNCYNIVKLNQDTLNTSGAQSVYNLFYGCTSLEEAPEMNFNNVIKNSYNIFGSCRNLYIVQNTFSFNSLVGSYSSITSVDNNCGLDGMFSGCNALTSAPTIIAPHVKSINNLFSNCTNLVSVPKQMNFPEAVKCNQMFLGCVSLSIAPSELNIPSALGAIGLFQGCSNLKISPYPNGTWDLSSVKQAYNFFYNCMSLTTIPNTIKLTDALQTYSFFYGCASLTTLPEMDLSNAVNISNMFYGCTGVSDLRGKNFIANNVLNLNSLFGGCLNMRYCYDKITAAKATEMVNTFYNCASLLRLPEIDAPNLTNFHYIAQYCSSLEETPDYYFPKLTTAKGSYTNCSSLKRVGTIKTDASSLDISNICGACTSIEVLDFPLCENGKISWSFGAPLSQNTTLVTVNNNVDLSCGANFTTIFTTTNQTSIKGTITFKGLTAAFTFTGRPLVTSIRLVSPGSNMQSFNISNCGLSAAALNILFGDLPNITNQSKITITGNPGALTCNKSLATAKGWTVINS